MIGYKYNENSRLVDGSGEQGNIMQDVQNRTVSWEIYSYLLVMLG